VVKLDGSSGFLDRDLILYAQVAEPHQPRLIYEVPLILFDLKRVPVAHRFYFIFFRFW
jgi:hypothetical protein